MRCGSTSSPRLASSKLKVTGRKKPGLKMSSYRLVREVKVHFGGFVLEYLLEIVCYGLGKIIVPIVTLGRARSQGESEIISFPWYGIARSSDGRLVVAPVWTAFCGFVVLFLSLVTLAAGLWL
jgi:hypothetical protein